MRVTWQLRSCWHGCASSSWPLALDRTRISTDAISDFYSNAFHLATTRPPRVSFEAICGIDPITSLAHPSDISGVIGFVAPAGSSFKSAAVENLDIAAMIADQFAISQ